MLFVFEGRKSIYSDTSFEAEVNLRTNGGKPFPYLPVEIHTAQKSATNARQRLGSENACFQCDPRPRQIFDAQNRKRRAEQYQSDERTAKRQHKRRRQRRNRVLLVRDEQESEQVQRSRFGNQKAEQFDVLFQIFDDGRRRERVDGVSVLLAGAREREGDCERQVPAQTQNFQHKKGEQHGHETAGHHEGWQKRKPQQKRSPKN